MTMVDSNTWSLHDNGGLEQLVVARQWWTRTVGRCTTLVDSNSWSLQGSGGLEQLVVARQWWTGTVGRDDGAEPVSHLSIMCDIETNESRSKM